MSELLLKEHIEFGASVDIIALCSKVEVIQNFSTTGSYREVYTLNGKDGAFISGIIFKMNGAPAVDIESFTDTPVLVKGTIGEYRDTKQVLITSISPLTDVLDKNDLLAEMVDSTILDEVNDILWNTKTMYTFSFQHLKPAAGLIDSGAGTLPFRLLKFLQMGFAHYEEYAKEYVRNISLLTHLYLETEMTLADKIECIKKTDSDLLTALLIGTSAFPEYSEFVKLHHLVMKPRGYSVEIVDYNTNNFGGSGRDIY